MYNLRSSLSDLSLQSNNSFGATEKFFSPPDPVDYTLKLNETRSTWIQEFKSSPTRNRGMGTPAWEQRLWKFLHKKEERILQHHLRNWIKNNKWIATDAEWETMTEDDHDDSGIVVTPEVKKGKQRKQPAVVFPTRKK
ncbi:hypothetical protein Ocin01_00102 [Orchesella cincta]|uniref:Uncharacterized protein n=1 Tax=Orchesella cincta TaxID=48709 RepID=A0A1D2NN74_ORCCI|nr:hypothetical protein Ocin01_00102 [Orchesella cincta]